MGLVEVLDDEPFRGWELLVDVEDVNLAGDVRLDQGAVHGGHHLVV